MNTTDARLEGLYSDAENNFNAVMANDRNIIVTHNEAIPQITINEIINRFANAIYNSLEEMCSFNNTEYLRTYFSIFHRIITNPDIYLNENRTFDFISNCVIYLQQCLSNCFTRDYNVLPDTEFDLTLFYNEYCNRFFSSIWNLMFEEISTVTQIRNVYLQVFDPMNFLAYLLASASATNIYRAEWDIGVYKPINEGVNTKFQEFLTLYCKEILGVLACNRRLSRKLTGIHNDSAVRRYNNYLNQIKFSHG